MGFGRFRRGGRMRTQRERNASLRFTAAMISDPQKRAEYERIFLRDLPPEGSPPRQRQIRRPVDGQPAAPLEKEIQRAIIQAIRLRKDVVFVGRFNRGQAVETNSYGETRYTPFNSVPGFPDIHGLLLGGRAFYIEVKRPPPHYRKPEKEQQEFLDAARVAGACAGVACSVEEAMALLP